MFPLDLTKPSTVMVLAALAAVVIFAALLIARSLGRRRSRRALVERVAELEALSAAGRAIVAAELDVDALCNLIAEQAGQVIDNRTFQVGLFDGGYYEIRYWTIDGQHQPVPQCFPMEDDVASAGGLVGWVRDSQQPLLVRDFQREMDALPARPTYHSDAPPRSALFLPLVSGDRTLGIVAAQSARPDHFSEQDLRRLTILANQAAAAIANARLFAQERTRAAHLELVTQIARQVNAADELSDVLQQAVRLTRQTFGFHPVTVFGIDPRRREVVVQASTLPERSGPNANGHGPEMRLPIGRGIIGTAAATRRTVAVNNTREDDRFVATLDGVPTELNPDTHAEIAIPLLVNDELLGVLDVQSPQVGAFGETEQIVLEALAAEVTSAVYKTQQVARQQEQAWITTAQLQVAETIHRHDERDEMLGAVARLAPLLVGVNLCAFLVWDEDGGVYCGATLVDRQGDEDTTFPGLRLAIGDWTALDAVHVGHEPLTTTHVPAWLGRHVNPGDACLRLYPLLGSARLRGVMVVDLDAFADCPEPADEAASGDPGFNARREELVRNVARQTASGLDSAYLRAAQQEEAWVNTALLQVAEAVNSLTDLNEILDTIVRLVPLLVGIDAVFILVWDDDRQIFQAGPSYGVSTMGRGLVETLEIDRDEFMAMSPQLALDSSQPRLPTPGYYAMRVPGWLETVLSTATAYNFPLVARGRLVGAMIVGLQRDRFGQTPFSNRRINILNGIAQQAATAVVNNQLYKESSERARMQQELDVAHTIQASFLPDGSPSIPGCSVATYWQAARQVGGDFYDFLPLGDDKWGVAIADVADKGVPAALFMALSRTILRAVAFSHNDPAHILSRANEIIGREARSDLFVTVFYGIWDPATERFTYANAGHNPPLLMQPNGNFQPLLGHGMALGILPEAPMKSQTLHLRPGDTILFYTDGVTEALNEDFDEFGLQRLQMAARAAARRPAAEIVRHITDGIRDHTGQTAQFDDMTLIVLKRLGAKSAGGHEAH